MQEQWAMFLNMKAYHIHLKEIRTLESLEQDDHREVTRINFKQIIPLWTFPEPDSKGNKCWSGDIFSFYKDTAVLFLVHTGYTWRLYIVHKIGKDNIYRRVEVDSKEAAKYVIKVELEGNQRVCSAFDNNAAELTGLDPETITNLKHLMEGM